MNEPTAVQPVVEMRGISIEFPGVKALDGVDFRLLPGEVHALMGENGAGKSTLIKALTGVYDIDDGTIVVAGTPCTFAGPRQAQEAGISTVYQEVNLCPNLTVGENILLGREPRRWGRIDYRTLNRRARELLAELELDIDPRSQLGSHPIAIQQLVAIARATAVRAQVLILDEPTSSLDAREVGELFRVIRRLRDSGTAILFVSHFLDQIYAISDRMTVLRNGKLVGEYLTAELPKSDLVAAMLGRQLDVLDEVAEAANVTAETAEHQSETLVRADALGRVPAVHPVTLDIGRGEILGLAGLLGSGRTELARLLFGADRATSGHVEIRGRRVALRTPRSAIAHGFAFTSENRKDEGVVGDLSVRENLVLALQARRGFARPLSTKTKDQLVAKYLDALDIRPRNPDTLLKNLSGGNQQKVLLARWLITEPDLFILDEPTRGIDVGAKTQIQKLVTELAGDGMAIVFISAELDEVTRISTRIAVMRDRHNVALAEAGTSPSKLTALIAGTS
ncbi:sugar ABC transporter ATP-binding protein [Mycolicibacterium smegmatis]|jgi:simple sugar transport system ATP-binding protein|nr:sugar ABC transporter ATP-binding protein [Mycolicibacterium smegmatis]AWT52711.1 ATP binding protein of ABC transporter [Mycolicibacterium smegmatis MKD8]MCC3333958.1 sugar ABC transporter ATP-binding protein [Mycolicibacterium smegmatis]MCO4197431.1 sugar ABC transporter ATP-binding protein [Mycolicibacterium smegmatis]MCP2623519.1 sugar ABC transporter ATP-binding protein [Mycolicibacterium smegmatis]MDF1900588.1 sugar ABC transporter ATP-binding protein [Mycolicibacterium smegmatis]